MSSIVAFSWGGAHANVFLRFAGLPEKTERLRLRGSEYFFKFETNTPVSDKGHEERATRGRIQAYAKFRRNPEKSAHKLAKLSDHNCHTRTTLPTEQLPAKPSGGFDFCAEPVRNFCLFGVGHSLTRNLPRTA